MKDLNRLNDVFMKYLLGSPERQKLTLYFITAMVGEEVMNKVSSLIFINREQGKEQQGDRGTIVDIMALLNNGTTVHIEVQVAKDKNIFARCLLYWSKQYGKGLKVSEGYDMLKPLVSIILCNYNRDDGNNRYYNRYHIYNDEDKTLATNHFDMVFVELTKFKIKDLNHLTDRERWLAYLGNKGNEKERSVIMNSEAMKEVQEAENRFLGDRALYNEYLRKEFARRDKQSQLQTALEDHDNKIICEMLNSNYDINEISRLFKRPVSEIQSLRNK